jgi:programmed cell death 6-interacting protein
LRYRCCFPDFIYQFYNFRLQYAQRLLNAGIERGHSQDLSNAKDWLRRTEKALTEAKKDNDFIYHERIPEEKALVPIGKVAVAKPTPLTDRLGTERTDLFEDLVPVAIHQVSALSRN